LSLRKLLFGAVLCVVTLPLVATYVTPWPSVWVIRGIFDKGAAEASAKLEKHVPQGVSSREGISYNPADKDALLDIHTPASVKPGSPTIVWIHGGGFVSGRRGDMTNYLKVLSGNGYVTVSVDYTLAPTAHYPTQVRQVARALEYLDAHAGGLGINRNAIVLAGDSAGAQIAAQATTIITNPAYAKAVGVDAPIEPAQLKGALLFCGVYDLAGIDTSKGGILGWFVNTVTWSYSGKRDWRDVPGFETMSVLPNVTPAFPPAFISAGNADPLEKQSVALDKALLARGVEVNSLFFAPNHEPGLPHEYQFDLDGVDGRKALHRTLLWLDGLRAMPAQPTSLAPVTPAN
jgi:acetyl esterase/lipase